jgi:hypothetical protein
MADLNNAPRIQTINSASQNAISPCSRHPHRITSTICSPFTPPVNEAIMAWCFSALFGLSNARTRLQRPYLRVNESIELHCADLINLRPLSPFFTHIHNDVIAVNTRDTFLWCLAHYNTVIVVILHYYCGLGARNGPPDAPRLPRITTLLREAGWQRIKSPGGLHSHCRMPSMATDCSPFLPM